MKYVKFEIVKPPRALKTMTKQKKIELLRLVRKMLARPKGWSSDGWEAPNPDRSYNALCLAAACQVAAWDMDLFRPGHKIKYATHVADQISLLKVVQDRGYHSVPSFNDSRLTKKKDVLAVIDERITQLEASKT